MSVIQHLDILSQENGCSHHHITVGVNVLTPHPAHRILQILMVASTSQHYDYWKIAEVIIQPSFFDCGLVHLGFHQTGR